MNPKAEEVIKSLLGALDDDQRRAFDLMMQEKFDTALMLWASTTLGLSGKLEKYAEQAWEDWLTHLAGCNWQNAIEQGSIFLLLNKLILVLPIRLRTKEIYPFTNPLSENMAAKYKLVLATVQRVMERKYYNKAALKKELANALPGFPKNRIANYFPVTAEPIEPIAVADAMRGVSRSAGKPFRGTQITVIKASEIAYDYMIHKYDLGLKRESLKRRLELLKNPLKLDRKLYKNMQHRYAVKRIKKHLAKRALKQ